MGVIARVVEPNEDLRYLDGPWRNDSCLGYMIEAMQRQNYSREEIASVVASMRRCFDDTTVEEAAYIWFKF